MDVYVAGQSDQIATGRTLPIQESSPDRWVGRIDTDLSAYEAVRLEVRTATGSAPFTVGPLVRGETLLNGGDPPPG